MLVLKVGFMIWKYKTNRLWWFKIGFRDLDAYAYTGNARQDIAALTTGLAPRIRRSSLAKSR